MVAAGGYRYRQFATPRYRSSRVDRSPCLSPLWLFQWVVRRALELRGRRGMARVCSSFWPMALSVAGLRGGHLEAGRSGRREMWDTLPGLGIERITRILAQTILLVIVCSLSPATSLSG